MKMQRAHYHLGRDDRQLIATFYPVQNGLLITGQNARSWWTGLEPLPVR